MTVCKTYKTSCKELRELGASRSGIYLVNFSSYELGLYNVSCDMESNGGGWTVFQRRQDGSENFYRGWQEYVHGFGDIASEFWLGNDLLHRITSSGEYTLRVDLGDFEGNATYAEYTGFSIAGAEEFYQLSISSYTGTAGDSLARHNGRNFSTWDADHDIQKTMNCALSFRGAWWYADCHNSNLNADYLGGFHDSFADGVNWGAFRGKYYSLKFTEMKIKLT
ncbi:hypothetical protein CAPTEDRAFT_98725 [Capitella teleta]|uniref:Fibrinogen C-terminal domain-containing protein n=1 Tax=Capitella teleta TaxID=283909 RepID=R7TIQ0_CAPTE|nr:hypothetical protein CAPTEDRAFT_98725 [Capitella teleta]|eukprot:ELT91416.1 hypothetical protein CAPTEDRAFT_98725 [Capitella teleta]